MGLFSSIKKGLSKAWSGTKKAIKGVARSVKKVAKKVAYAVPGGKALWDLSSKIGGEVMKGIGKISAKLGPVGMMALSFVLAPVMGPMVTSLWGSVSSVAGGIASQAATFVSSLGSVGTAIVNGVTSAAKGIYAAGNFVGGTVDAMSRAITEGASNVMNGQFSKAASSFATNMSDAFTGKAGMASVNQAAAQSALASGELLGDPGQVMGTPGGSFEPVDFGLDPTGSAGVSLDPSLTTNIGNVGSDLGNVLSPTGPQFTPLDTPLQTMAQQGQEALYGKVGNLSLTEQDAFMKYGAEGVKGIQPGAVKAKSNLLDKAKKAKDLYDGLGGTGAASGYQPYVPQAIQSQTISNASTARGQGSAGFSLLGGVQGLEQSIRNSQKIMFG
jgi:hypothetical protein